MAPIPSNAPAAPAAETPRKLVISVVNKTQAPPPNPYAQSLTMSLTSFVKRGGRVETVIDVGASDSRWSREVLRTLPKARYHMVEALPFHRPGLEKLTAENPNVSFVLAAAGPRVGNGFLACTGDPLGGAACETNPSGDYLSVPMVSIDHEVARLGLKPPYFLKLDTHGFELEILEGAKETLAQASLVQIEVYNFDVRVGAPRFPDLCRHMETIGFRCSGAFDVLNRPLDGAFWQLDLLFEPLSSPMFKSNAWDAPAAQSAA